MRDVVVAGIGTGVGKSFISAILTEALEADYWKPIQSGNLDFTDTDFVRQHVTNPQSTFHPEAYRLSAPMSPHAAAKIDQIEININQVLIPQSSRPVVIELAGGIMVPLNQRHLNIDILKKWNAPVVLVSQNYLGSINHTLLSVEILKLHQIKIIGIIFNGVSNAASEDFILSYTEVPCLAKVDQVAEINRAVVEHYARALKSKFKTDL